ncbi:MAG: helix-turn-helix domain-containing protein [Oscillospiraceae bacterium]|nr:helix-turn-helix domain-containing protein [Oscillospiraceae bacterium]
MRLNLKLKFLRTAEGFTQQEMADYLGVQKTTYSHYESGKRVPDRLKITKISERFSAPANFLIDDRAPVVIQQKCPQDLLDALEHLISNTVVTKDRRTDCESCRKLQEAGNKIMAILSRQGNIPPCEFGEDSFPWDDVISRGYSPMTIYLDIRANALLDKSLALQDELLKRYDLGEV